MFTLSISVEDENDMISATEKVLDLLKEGYAKKGYEGGGGMEPSWSIYEENKLS